MFVSNIDNLGSTVDIRILHMLLSPSDGHYHEYCMEVTDKTRADIKVCLYKSKPYKNLSGWHAN